MKKIYVGCSLMHAPEEFVEGIVALKNELRKHHEIMDFVGLGDHVQERFLSGIRTA